MDCERQLGSRWSSNTNDQLDFRLCVSRRGALQQGIFELCASHSISISILTMFIIPLGVDSVLREAVMALGMGLLVMAHSDATSSPTRRRCCSQRVP
jgi:hypothetical protein